MNYTSKLYKNSTIYRLNSNKANILIAYEYEYYHHYKTDTSHRRRQGINT